jgi:hypothetical protein
MPLEDIQDVVRHWRYTPTDECLANPHKGCCTFQRFNGDPLYPGIVWSEEGPLNGALTPNRGSTGIPNYSLPDVTPGYLPTTVAYCRWFWEKLEPRQGQYDFSMIDKALDACRQRGQTLAVRLMPFGHMASGQPGLPKWYDNRFPKVPYGNSMEEVPDYDSPQYLDLWGNLHREFARRYDGNPLLETVDVAFLGPWGEGDGECSQAQIDRFAELYQRAFAHTPTLVLIGGGPGGDQLHAGVSRGSGWRADCFGDLRRTMAHPAPLHFRWNHMFNCYPKRLHEAGAQEVWRRAPVHFETCDVPLTWHRQGFDLDFILEQGLKYHTTYFMPKSVVLPEPWLDNLSAFCEKIGYRFIFRQATLGRRVRPDEKIVFRAWIENVGVAPIYRRYNFGLRLKQGDREKVVILDDVDIRSWLPGDVWLDHMLPLPEGTQPGWVEVSAGLLDPASGKPAVNFAVKERFADRWVLLGGFEVLG